MVQIFTCPACDVLPFRYILHYNTHMEKFHWQQAGKKLYRCSICPASEHPTLYPSIKQMLLHSKSHDHELHHCSYCPAVFPVVTYKLLHERNEHFSDGCKEREYGCERCGKVFESRMMLASHLVLEHGKETVSMVERLPEVYQCNHCDDYIKSHKNLMIHMKKHNKAQREGLVEESSFSGFLTNNKTSPSSGTREDSASNVNLGGTMYICPVCDVLPFQNEKHYLLHIEKLHWQNTSDGMYVCSACTMEPPTFTTLQDMVTHCLSHTDRYHYCRFCDACFPFKKYTSIHERNEHLLVDLPKAVYRCDTCGEVFDRRRSLGFHCIEKHQNEVVCMYANFEEVYKCNHCSERIRSQHELILHITKHNDIFSGQQAENVNYLLNLEPPEEEEDDEVEEVSDSNLLDQSTLLTEAPCQFFICPVCDVPPFQSQTSYNLHVERFHYIKTPDNTYTCAQCKSPAAIFTTLHEMLTHASQEMERYYKCRHCDAVFTVERLNTLHERNEHGAPLLPLTLAMSCSVCGEVFASRKMLAQHSIVSHGVETFTMVGQASSTYHCNFCQRSFPHTKALLAHITEHSQNVTRGAIEIIPQSNENVESKESLDETNDEECNSLSMRGEQATLYVCPICDSLPFRREALYESHMSKYHWKRTPDSKFSCTHCQDRSSMFDDIKDMAEHSLQHVSKLEKCNFCEACIPTAIYRTLHERNEHVGRAESKVYSYTCQVCGLDFDRRKGLAFHSLMEHDVAVFSFKGRLASVYGCNHCKQYIKSRVELLSHIKGHRTVCSQHYQRIDAIREGRGEEIKHNTNSKLKIIQGRNLRPKRLKKKGPLSSTLIQKYKNKSKTSLKKERLDSKEELSESNNLAYVCPICDVHPFRYESYFETHMEQMHWKCLPDDKYMCSQCKTSTQIYTGIHEISEHAQRDMLTGNNVFRCERCDARFYNKHQLTLHLRNDHSGEGKDGSDQFDCGECGQQFHRRRLLANHAVVSHRVGKFTFSYDDVRSVYPCNHCDVRCCSSKQLSTHMASHKLLFLRDLDPAPSGAPQSSLTPGGRRKRPEKTGPFLCSDCGLVFNSQRRYAYHVPIHWKEYKYECETCQKTFPTRQRLMLHDRFHTRKYMCNDCGERFAQLGHLKSHQKSNHTREPCFFCEICGNGFLWAISLRRHMFNVHQIGEKKRLAYVRKLVECQICNHRLDRSKRTKHFRSRHKDLDYSLNYFVPVDQDGEGTTPAVSEQTQQQEQPQQQQQLQTQLQQQQQQNCDLTLTQNVTQTFVSVLHPDRQQIPVTTLPQQLDPQLYNPDPFASPGHDYLNTAGQVIQTDQIQPQQHQQQHALSLDGQNQHPTVGQEMCVTIPSQEHGQQTIMLYIP